MIFCLYCEGDLPKPKFRLVVYDAKQTEPQNPFWLMALQTMQPRHQEDKSTVDLRGE